MQDDFCLMAKWSQSADYGPIHTSLFGAQLHDNKTHVAYDHTTHQMMVLHTANDGHFYKKRVGWLCHELCWDVFPITVDVKLSMYSCLCLYTAMSLLPNNNNKKHKLGVKIFVKTNYMKRWTCKKYTNKARMKTQVDYPAMEKWWKRKTRRLHCICCLACSKKWLAAIRKEVQHCNEHSADWMVDPTFVC